MRAPNTRFFGFILSSVMLFLSLLTLPATAEEPAFRLSISPYLAQRGGGRVDKEDGKGELDFRESDAYGVVLSGPAGSSYPNGIWEINYARQETNADTIGLLDGDPRLDIDIEYFHVGGALLFESEFAQPFFAAGLGMSRFDPRASPYDAESFFSASMGGGLNFPVNQRLGLRVEARLYTTLVSDSSQIFCSSTPGLTCLIDIDGSWLVQWEARAGINFQF